jgi:hypothetical protein
MLIQFIPQLFVKAGCNIQGKPKTQPDGNANGAFQNILPLHGIDNGNQRAGGKNQQ